MDKEYFIAEFGKIHARFERIETRLGNLENKVDVFYGEFVDFKAETNQSFFNIGESIEIIMNSAVHKKELAGIRER